MGIPKPTDIFETVDVGSLAYRREHMVPKSSLPTIKHLRLCGQMSFAPLRGFVDAIDSMKLVSMELDKLQDFGRLEDVLEYQVDDLLNYPLGFDGALVEKFNRAKTRSI